ncbi:MAG: hypothetical protein AAFQ13_00700 [Pseudomonadota bacterium]
MMPALMAEERIARAQDGALSAGTLPDEAREALTRELDAAARPGQARRAKAATRADLSAAGIGPAAQGAPGGEGDG